jgi:hypothetical protein
MDRQLLLRRKRSAPNIRVAFLPTCFACDEQITRVLRDWPWYRAVWILCTGFPKAGLVWFFDLSRSLSNEHSNAIPDVLEDSISPTAYPVLVPTQMSLQVPNEKWWNSGRCYESRVVHVLYKAKATCQECVCHSHTYWIEAERRVCPAPHLLACYDTWLWMIWRTSETLR